MFCFRNKYLASKLANFYEIASSFPILSDLKELSTIWLQNTNPSKMEKEGRTLAMKAGVCKRKISFKEVFEYNQNAKNKGKFADSGTKNSPD